MCIIYYTDRLMENKQLSFFGKTCLSFFFSEYTPINNMNTHLQTSLILKGKCSILFENQYYIPLKPPGMTTMVKSKGLNSNYSNNANKNYLQEIKNLERPLFHTGVLRVVYVHYHNSSVKNC